METEHTTPAREETVRSELVRILDSAAFRGTRRSRDFLRYVVEHALEGDLEALKERSIGIEVFGRPVDYDTGQDSIVRVKANEVRKRLAQYCGQPGAGSQVQIDLPAGSYSPEFRWRDVAQTPPRPPRLRRGLWIASAAAAALIALAGVALWQGRRPSALESFWRPVLQNPQPVLLCVAHPVVYHLQGDTRLRVLQGGAPPQLAPWAGVVRDPDHYVGVGDAFALAQLSAFFGRSGKPSQIRIGADTSFADLRYSPAVLIGAFTNQWTMQMTRDCRFVFEREGGDVLIKDRADPKRRWVRAETTPPSEYAILSRLIDSKTGGVVVVGAGLAHYGTHMAGEVLTNAARMEEALREAPAGWQSRNFQIVLRAEIIGQTPGPSKVLATHFW